MSTVSKRIGVVLLIVMGLVGFVSIYYTFNPSQHSFFIPCPFHYMTGYHCPGCGSQRAIHQILHGDLMAAFWINPLLLLSIPILLYAFGQRAYNYVFKTQYRVSFFYHKWFIYGYFGIAILFWIARNIAIYPFTLLSPDYHP